MKLILKKIISFLESTTGVLDKSISHEIVKVEWPTRDSLTLNIDQPTKRSFL